MVDAKTKTEQAKIDKAPNDRDLIEGQERFRATIATVDEKGKRLWVYPKKPSGRHHRARIAVTIGLLALLFAGPFLKVNGHAFFLFNFFERKFIVFGQIFWPQDFFLLAITLITFFLFIILFTVVFGRIWCGWLCPQTLFMEMVFRKIEYLIEGDMAAQRRLARAPWDFAKVKKKALKHGIFALISVIIAHTLLAYIVGIDKIQTIISHEPSENPAAFAGMAAFTGIFYWLFAFFREQACTAVCPYGRLQGVLLGKKSIVVAYDWVRGEPRGHLKKTAALATAGDCVDCRLCVQVCPTGIDIRNGTQLECVNCTACIDACDDVMFRIGKPEGLIRFASLHAITSGIEKLWTRRVTSYSIVLLFLLAVLALVLGNRTNVETTMLKVSGTLYQREPGLITNLYNAEFINKTFESVVLEVRVESPASATIVKVDGKTLVVPPEGMIKAVYFIKIAEKEVRNARTVVRLGIYEHGKKIETLNVKFIGPVSKASDARR